MRCSGSQNSQHRPDPTVAENAIAAVVVFLASSLLVDLDLSSELLILVADELDQLRVGQDLLVDPDGKRLGVRLRIVDGDVDLEPSECRPPETLGEFRLLAVWATADVKPAIARTILRASEVVGFDDERVALPAADRVAVPLRLRFALLRQRPAVGVD